MTSGKPPPGGVDQVSLALQFVNVPPATPSSSCSEISFENSDSVFFKLSAKMLKPAALAMPATSSGVFAAFSFSWRIPSPLTYSRKALNCSSGMGDWLCSVVPSLVRDNVLNWSLDRWIAFHIHHNLLHYFHSPFLSGTLLSIRRSFLFLSNVSLLFLILSPVRLYWIPLGSGKFECGAAAGRLVFSYSDRFLCSSFMEAPAQTPNNWFWSSLAKSFLLRCRPYQSR